MSVNAVLHQGHAFFIFSLISAAGRLPFLLVTIGTEASKD